jgi:hypothetical protein
LRDVDEYPAAQGRRADLASDTPHGGAIRAALEREKEEVLPAPEDELDIDVGDGRTWIDRLSGLMYEARPLSG